MEPKFNLQGSRTERNVENAFGNEAMAGSAYLYYAHAARKAGFSLISDALMEIAQNEEEHARTFFDYLARIKDTRTNLENAIQNESGHSRSFSEYARIAEEEGFDEISGSFQRMSRVEEKHQEIFKNLLDCLDENVSPEERTIGHSSVTLVQIMLPHHANSAGFVHGGEIMKMMDNAAGVVAARHAHTNVVTARVEELNFFEPVRVGDLVFACASLTFVGHSSMEVRVEVETENFHREERQRALTAYFIYVALDSEGKPTSVPSLLITTEQGEKLFREGKQRYEARKKNPPPPANPDAPLPPFAG